MQLRDSWGISALTVATVLCLVTTPGSAQTTTQEIGGVAPERVVDGSARLAPADRAVIARTPADRPLTVLLASGAAEGGRLASLVRSVGGTVVGASSRAGFVLAEVPAGHVSSLEAAPEIDAIQLDREVLRVPDDTPPASVRGSASVSATADDSPPPYAPTGDIGAPQFVDQHPRFDGRGITIAIIEGNPDPSAPGLQITSTGRRKIAKVYDASGTQNIVTDKVVHPSGDQIAVDGVSYILPPGRRGQPVRFGLLDEAASFGFVADLNVDGDATDRFGVLVTGWTRPQLRMWIDTDQDQSFAGEDPLADFNTTFPYSLTTLGHDDPGTSQVEEVMAMGASPCQVSGTLPCGPAETDRLGDRWEVIPGWVPHSTFVASTAAGQGMHAFGQSWDGIAPGAQIMSFTATGDSDFVIRASDFSSALLSAAEQGADVISTSAWAPFDKPLAAVMALADNLISAYGVSFTQFYGNFGPGTHTPESMAANDAIAVGASITPRTYAANLGRDGIPHEGLIWYSSQGPYADGGFRPDVVAPTALLTGFPTWYTGGTAALNHFYPGPDWPPGYRIGGGTSQATPVVAGAVALLLSSAKQSGLETSPHSIKRALALGARPMDRYQVSQQGHGVVQVPAAWQWLQRLEATHRDLRTSPAGIFAKTTAGSPAPTDTQHTIDVTNTERRTHNYRISASQPWISVDNDTIQLPAAPKGRQTSAELTVRLDPSVVRQHGLHSGVIRYDDPTTADPADHETLITVLTGRPLTEQDDYTLHVSGAGDQGIEAATSRSVFVATAGLQAITITSTTPADSPAGVDVYVPARETGLRLAGPNRRSLLDPGSGNQASITIPITGRFDTPVLEVAMVAHEIQSLTNPPDYTRPVIPYHPYDVTITGTPSG
jgi:hypothetical protein